MISPIELKNRINQYRERAVELQSEAPNWQFEDTQDAMLDAADDYEFMADMLEKFQNEERPLLN
jgi:spore coat polysaccharide biosynthesis protein SpsF (cytidylyltransferase family)